MYHVIVSVFVKPEHVPAFRAASLDNARHTRQEPGNVSFEVVAHEDDLTRFTLLEVYRTRDDFAAHQRTEHYLRWRQTVADWMAQPRSAVRGTKVE
jgi:autoinducer 2-degrading protein